MKTSRAVRTTPSTGLIDDIIVHQASRMNHFHNLTQAPVLVRDVAADMNDQSISEGGTVRGPDVWADTWMATNLWA